MSEVNLSAAMDGVQAMSMPPASLRVLYLFDCNLNATFSSLPLYSSNLTSLVSLGLGGNYFHGPIPNGLLGNMTYLEKLGLGGNDLISMIPRTLKNLHNLKKLILWDNQINGDIAELMKRLPPKIEGLYLSANNLVGSLPSWLEHMTSLRYLYLGYNSLRGPIPFGIGKLTNLSGLYLSSNHFVGIISEDHFANLTRLEYLSLSDNSNLTMLAKLDYLHVLDLAHNNLSGTIAPSLVNFTAMTIFSSYGSYYLPDFISLLVVTKGQALEYYSNTIMSLMSSLDLSSNYLSGTIPQEIGGLATLKNLNLSGNRLIGNIPETMGGLRSLESLDLSNNELYGEIPPTLSVLTFLSYLNLSYNNLSGRIPSGQQLQTLDDPSIYKGNNNLCGPPISKNCSGGDGTTLDDPLELEDGNEMSSFYLSMGLGFAVGLWVVIGPLLFKRTWCATYFLFIDNICDKIYVFMVLNWARLIANIKKK
ncbi:receptor-like protein 45 [Typha latifolia]|uniref:receptor-like protein 45 n=1 Tax=Typha latifolia TaxID=4733 RepID=UPI003C2D52CE